MIWRQIGPCPFVYWCASNRDKFRRHHCTHTTSIIHSSRELFTCVHSDYMQTAAVGIINFFRARCVVCSTEILLSSLLNSTVCRVYLCVGNEITPNKLFCGVWRALLSTAHTCKLNARRRCHPVICYLWGARLISDFDGHSTRQVFSMCAPNKGEENAALRLFAVKSRRMKSLIKFAVCFF